MSRPKIAKTKWYLFRLTDSTLLLSKGAFETESKANRAMFQPAAIQHYTTAIQLERKKEYDGVTTIKGEILIKRMARTEIKLA
jgi:hypothetical protein